MSDDGTFACANIDEWCYCPTHNKAWMGTPSGCCKTGRYMSMAEECIFKLGRADGYESRVKDEENEKKVKVNG